MTAPGSAVVRFDSVGKRYRLGRERVNLRPAMPGAWGANVQGNAHTALKDISFALAPGESLGIVGPNGAGKSTMLKLVAGVIAASSGSVKVRGRTAALIELGAGFHPDMTGRENIGFSAAVLGMSKKQLALRVDEIIAFADIGHYLDTPVKRYSSGMMARLGFAIASHLDVDVLVLDEVLAVGDASFQTRCHERILALRDTGCATLYVTHALWTLPLLCQRAILLGGGTVVAEGTPMHVLEAYRNQAGQRNNAVETPQGAQLWIHDITVTPPTPGPGDAVTITVTVTAPMDAPQAELLIGITSSNGVIQAGASQGIGPLRTDERRQLSCTIPSMPFLSGRYDLHVTVFPDAALPVVADTRAIPLEVESPPVNPEFFGHISLRETWDVN